MNALSRPILFILACSALCSVRIAAQEACQLPKPQEPRVGSVSSSAVQLNAHLIGFAEFATPSSPPKKYRKKTTSGTMNWGRWGTAVSPFEYPSAWTDFESGLPAPGDPFGTYQYTAFLSPTGNVRSDGFVEYIAGGSAQRSDGAPLTLRVNADALGGVLFDVGQTRYLNPLAGLHSVNAVISGNVTISGRSRLMRVGGAELNRDEWGLTQEYAADDYLGATLAASGANARYRGLSNDFPLVGGVNIGQPNTGDYTSLVTTSATATVHELQGTGSFVTFSNPVGSGKAEGTYREELSVEDKEADARARVRAELEKSPGQRAPNSVVQHAAATAYYRTRGNGFTFSAQRAVYSAGFDIACPGMAEFVVHYTVAPAANPSAVQKRSVSYRMQLPAGPRQITVVAVPSGWTAEFSSLPEGDFTLQVSEVDTDYTITGIELIQPCGGGGDGGELLNAIGSVRSHFTLGRGPADGNSGVIRLEADTVSAALYSPAALLLAAAGDGTVAEVRDAAGVLRQVKAPQVFADIVTLSASSYEIRFHALANVGTADPVTGVYSLSGTPFAVYRIEDPTPATPGLGLRITEIRGSLIKVIAYTRDATTGALTLSTGNGLRRETMQETVGSNTRSTLTTVLNADDTIALKVARTYQTFPGGREEMTSETLDPDGAALATTWTYDASGRLLGIDRPDGSWERHSNHDSLGRPTKTVRPFGNSTPAAGDDQSRVEAILYLPVSDLDGDSLPEQLTQVTVNIQGQRVAKRYTIEWSKSVVLASEGFARRWESVATNADGTFLSADNLVTEILTYGPGPFAGRPRRVVNPDGTATLTTYALDATGSQTMVQKTGAPNAAKDDITDGTRTTTFTNASGHVTGEAVVDIASNLTLTSWTATQFDALGRPTRMDHADGTYETRDYACCGLASRRDRDGTVTSWTYDALGRPTHQTANGITVRTAYDAEGRTLSTTRIGTDASEIVQETLKYDPAGRLIERRDALNRLTTTLEEFNPTPAIARRVTTTNPDGGTRIEAYQRDGTLLSVSGTAVAPLAYTYGVDSTREIRVGDGGATSDWTQTTYDHAGRPRFAITNGAGTSNYFYNNAGQLIRTTDPDGVATLYAYNARGEQTVTALDMNGNGVIDYAGTDRITRTTSDVTTRDGVTVARTTTQVWETDGADTPVTVSVSEQSADGLRSWQTTRGLTTSTTTVLDGTGGRTVTTTAPDGTVSTQVFTAGRLVSQAASHSSLGQLSATTLAYDAHGRLQTSTDARNGTTSYSYHNDDQLHTVTTPDPDPSRTGDGYDPQTNTYGYDAAGRQSTVTQPDGGVVTTEYYPTGQVKKTYGTRTYPVEYTYDAQQRLKTLKTWQNFAGDTGAAVTTWNYDATRGLLQNKRYADNTGPGYTYWPSGRLRTRIWARGITTTYSYNTAGDLTGVDYSDSTPDVTFAYDRAGRPRTRTDASGTCNWTYNPFGQLEDEAYTAGLLNGLSLDRSFDSLARLSSLSALSVSSVLNQTGYSYDAASRLDTVTQGANTATYAYMPNSPLVSIVTFRNGGTTRLTTTKNYDQLNRLASISSVPSASSAVSASYLYNSANQRTKLTREDNRYWDYGYDSLGQVTGATKKLADATPVLGHSFGYTFDDIGNRKTATANGQTSAYSANLLNQYDSRTVPAAFDVSGVARFDSTVTLTVGSGLPQSVNRQGDLFFKQVPVDNSSLAAASNLKITGVKNLVGAAGEDAVTELTRLAFTPKTPEVFSHDLDGNLTADAKWIYTWDGENRLIAIETTASALAAGAPKRKLEFAYDGQSRRFAKKVYNWDGAAWQLGSSTRFLYDSWNLIAEMDALSANAPVRTYAWGLDLSGSLQGAGGVGGLLFATLQPTTLTSTHAPALDGNGNIIAYVDMATSARSATFEYGAFGETLIADGPLANNLPFRFSTKFTDTETGHLYYGLRYYSPNMGSWLCKDTTNEEGGINLLAFVFNDPANYFDPNGASAKSMVLTAVNSGRRLLGVPFSILSGDIFDNPNIVTEFSRGVCKISISINGIWNNDQKAADLMNAVADSPRYQNTKVIRVTNRTHIGIGDLLQIIGNEIGAIDVTAARAAKQINLAAAALKKNGCCCGFIQVLGHSQGAMVFNRALPLLTERAKRLICFTSIGGEKAVVRNVGLSKVENYNNVRDWVPYFGNYNPIRLLDIPQMVAGFDLSITKSPSPSWFEHSFNPHYFTLLNNLKPNCPCTPIE